MNWEKWLELNKEKIQILDKFKDDNYRKSYISKCIVLKQEKPYTIIVNHMVIDIRDKYGKFKLISINGHDCENLIIPEGVDDCIDTDRNINEVAVLYSNEKEYNVYIPSTMNEIPEKFMQVFESLKRLYISEGVTIIKKSAFEYCRQLSQVYMPSTLISIDRFAFHATDSLKELHLSGDIKEIKNFSFKGSGLEKLRINSEKIEEIGCEAFSLTKLKEVEIHGLGVLHICKSAFEKCEELSIFKSSGVHLILDDYVFYDCNKLKNFYGYVNKIKEFVFVYTSITELELNGLIKTSINSFNSMRKLAKIKLNIDKNKCNYRGYNEDIQILLDSSLESLKEVYIDNGAGTVEIMNDSVEKIRLPETEIGNLLVSRKYKDKIVNYEKLDELTKREIERIF